MQPLDHHELRWQSAALVEAANGAARARRAGVGLQRSRGEARYDFNVHAQPSPVVDHETPHHEYTSRHHYQAGQTSRGHHRRPADDEGYQAEMTWNQPAMAPRSAGRQLPPLPLRVKPEPRNSVRLTEAPPETFRDEMSPRMNHFPRGMRSACYPSDKVVDQSQPGSRYLAKPKPEYPCSSGDERRNVDLDRLLPHGARLGAADKGASDSRRHRRQDGAVPTGKNEREQTNRIPSQPQRQRRVKGRDPGDSPSSPDSGGEDGGRPPNRQSGTNLPKKGDKKKGRKPSGSSPDPSDGNSSDGSELPDSDDNRPKSTRKSRHARVARGKKSYLKLKDFDGRTCVEAYLARFEVVSQHNGWNEADRLENLQCALEGNAAQVLWDQGSQGIKSCRRLIRHLRQRFGSEGQQCVYRTQLRTRVRPKGEPLSVTVDEVRRLMALAYPGPMSGDKQTIAIDALLNMLGDGELVLKIREREPETLEEAFKVAMKLEAFQLAGAGHKETERKSAYARQVQSEATVREPTAELKVLMKEYNQLQSEKLDRLFDKLRQSSNPAPTSDAPPTEMDGNLRQRSFGRGGGRRRAPQREPRPGDRCYNCGQEGHFSNKCPQPRTASAPTNESTLYPIPNFVSPPAPAGQNPRNSGIAGGAPGASSA